MDESEKDCVNESQQIASTESADEKKSLAIDYRQYLLDELAEEPVIEIPEFEFENEHEREIAEWTSYLWLALRREYPGKDDSNYDCDLVFDDEYSLEELRDVFTKLGAIDIFLRSSLESCIEQVETNKERLQKALDVIDKTTQLVVNEENKKAPSKRGNIARYIKNREKDKLKLITLKSPQNQKLETKISELRRELMVMGFVGPDYKKKSVFMIKRTGIVNGKLGSTSKITNMMVNGGVIGLEINR